MPDVIGEAFVAIRPETAGFAPELKRQLATGASGVGAAGEAAGGEAGKGLVKGLNPVVKQISGIVGGAFAVRKVGQFLGDSLAQAQESNKVAAQTDAALRSIGRGAHISAGGIGDLATAISNKVGIDDEAIQSGENLLLTFKNIRNETGKGNDIFTRTTKAAVDLSVAFKQDLKSSSIQLGKALNDPVKGVSALQRVGVSFTESQKAMIKSLVDSGDVLGAQKIILKEVESQVKGSAEKQATSADKMRVAWGNMQETIGKALLPVMNALVKVAQPIAAFLAEHEGLVKALAVAIGGALVAAFVAWAVSASAAAAATLAAAAPVLAIVAAIGLVVAAAVLLWTNWDQVWTWIKDHPAIAIVIAILAAPVAAFVLIIGALHTLYENWDAIWGAIQGVVQFAWDNVFKPIWDGILHYFDLLVWGVGVLEGIWDGIFDGLSNAWNAVGAPVLATILGAVNAVIDAYRTLRDFFNSITDTATPNGIPTTKGGYPDPVRKASGGWVPGFGNGDTVPALLTPGEYVMSKAEVAAARSGGGPQFHFNVHGDIANPVQWMRAAMTTAHEETIVGSWS